MRGAAHRPLTNAPRLWCSGAAFAAVVVVVVTAAAASGALADTGAPADTTPAPTPTVTTPDASPPVSAPKPDPAPVHVVPKPRPHVVHRTAPVAPVVVQPVYQPPATARATPTHVVARRKHLAELKHRATPRRVPQPRPAAAKPRRQGPAIPLRHASARSSSGGGLEKILIVAGLALLLLSAVLAAARRALRPTPDAAIASGVGLTSPNGSGPNGSGPVRHDDKLLPTQPVLPTTPVVEIASDVGLTSPNGSNNRRHDEEFLPLEEEFLPLETLRHLPTRSHPPIPAAEERCAIGWWRGYVRSQFLAWEPSEAGSKVIAESPPFAWRSNKPPPQTDEAVAAHRQLVAALSDLGWEAVESGPEWFEVEFHRDAVASVTT
jgi:hypothetical protein